MPKLVQRLIAKFRNRVEASFKEITDQMELLLDHPADTAALVALPPAFDQPQTAPGAEHGHPGPSAPGRDRELGAPAGQPGGELLRIAAGIGMVGPHPGAERLPAAGIGLRPGHASSSLLPGSASGSWMSSM
jgi:hypothetical protein